jgi:hypothetical protein
MKQHIFLILKKVIGSILIVLGIIGAFIPIPLVPFFLLAVLGLGLIGVNPKTINKIKKYT